MPNAADSWNGQGRAPFQVLVLPYVEDKERIAYAVFRRADAGYWQFIAGGGEGDEQPIQAARREAWEEAGIPETASMFRLDSTNTVPVMELAGRLLWGPHTLVVPEYTFGVCVPDTDLKISAEHSEYQWLDYQTCRSMLRWDSNRNALLELNDRIIHGLTPDSATTA